MDRVAPSRRPNSSVFGGQAWKNLLFVHWPVPIDALRALVPSRLELDLFDGEAYVGIVPFAMHEIRPRFWPKRLGLNFLETNLRTYVHLDGDNPGVYFFSLEASSKIAVRVARASFGLPYYDAEMSMHVQGDATRYETRRVGTGASFRATWTVGESLGVADPGTADHFLLERYYLYSEHRGRLVRGQVHHAPYPAHLVSVSSIHESLFAAAGLPPAVGEPAFVHYSPGVEVEVFRPIPV